jgi:hypothetical protein
MTQFWISRTLLAALAAALGLALSSTSAQAQVCGSLDDLAGDLAEDYSLAMEDFLPQDDATCEKWVKSFLAACQGAIRGAAQCNVKKIASLVKSAKPICKEAGGNCSADLKEGQEDAEGEIDDLEAAGLEHCEDVAFDLFLFCQDPN